VLRRIAAGVVVLLLGCASSATADTAEDDRTVGGALFGPEVWADVPSSGGAHVVALGDVTEDDGLEVVSVSRTSNPVTVWVHEWVDGQLELVSSTPVEPCGETSCSARSVAVGDVLAAAGPEIVVGGQGGIEVLRTDGPAPVPTGERAASGWAVRIGDVTGDGRADVVSTDVTGHDVYILEQTPAGELAAPITVATPDDFHSGLELADVDGDDLTDIVAVDAGPVVVVFRQTTDGFDAPVATPVPGFGSTATTAVGDVMGDDRPEVVVQQGSGVDVLSPDVDGDLQLAETIVGTSGPRGAATADVDGDGDLDLVTQTDFSQTIMVHFQGDDGLDPQFQQYPASGGSAAPTSGVAVGDLTGDGRPDVVIPTTYVPDGNAEVVVVPSTTSATRYEDPGFTDDPAWARDAIWWARTTWSVHPHDDPVMAGYTDGTFRPARPTTRAEFARALWRALGTPGYGQRQTFADPIPAWARPAVWFVAFDHPSPQEPPPAMPPYADGRWRPSRQISRGEAALAVYRVDGARDVGGRPQPFVDVPPRYDAAVRWMMSQLPQQTGTDDQRPYATGFGNQFRPNAPLTRAQAAAWLYRIYG
jgi:hypothetical protein